MLISRKKTRQFQFFCAQRIMSVTITKNSGGGKIARKSNTIHEKLRLVPSRKPSHLVLKKHRKTGQKKKTENSTKQNKSK